MRRALILLPLHAMCVGSAILGRRAVLAGGASVVGLLSSRSPANAADELETIVGRGFSIQLPPSYYRPKGGRPKTAIYDDNALVAADYASGRVASVTVTTIESLYRDAGQPEVLQGPLSELKELGRPTAVAALLARRRDGDPAGILAQPRSQVISSVRDGNTLRFVLAEKSFTATSMTQAQPTARIVQGRALFLSATDARPALLVTAWAGSSAPSVQCVPQACEAENGRLSFDCPAPRCDTGGELPQDALDVRIVDSLSAST